jgi:hypothetical protein
MKNARKRGFRGWLSAEGKYFPKLPPSRDLAFITSRLSKAENRMSNTQNALPVGVAEQAAFEPVPDRHSSPLAVSDGGDWSELGMDEDAASGGHNLLSRSATLQGRRSLFRR